MRYSTSGAFVSDSMAVIYQNREDRALFGHIKKQAQQPILPLKETANFPSRAASNFVFLFHHLLPSSFEYAVSWMGIVQKYFVSNHIHIHRYRETIYCAFISVLFIYLLVIKVQIESDILFYHLTTSTGNLIWYWDLSAPRTNHSHHVAITRT